MFVEVNSAALATQRKTEEDFARVRKLAAQIKKTRNLRWIKYMTHGLNKKEPKVISSDKSKVFKFTREPSQSKPPWKTQKGVSLFVCGNVKVKETLEDSDKFSNVRTMRRRKRPRQKKVDRFALRDQELEIEEDKRKQRRHANWNKQQRSKIGRATKVRALDI